MLADLLPLMTDTVRQWHQPLRSIFGKITSSDATDHRARVVHSPGKTTGPASHEAVPDATATVWLIDHPYPIAIGDTFELTSGEALKVVRLECQRTPSGMLHKVYLT